MAGEWIKMRTNLWDDPRVSQMCDITGAKEATVIGALYWLWAAADEHTENGFMPGLSVSAIDRKAGVKGFGAALVSIGWLEDAADGVTVIRFDEHNGSSAKRRGADAQRKANVRKPSAPDADKTRNSGGQPRKDCGAREEKRREEYSVPDGTGGDAAEKRDKTPAERRKSELWRAMKEFLVEAGESKDLKSAGAIITAAIRRFDEPTALAGIEATLHKKPAGAIAFLEAACQQATGQRPNKQEALEADNLAAAERFGMEEDHAPV